MLGPTLEAMPRDRVAQQATVFDLWRFDPLQRTTENPVVSERRPHSTDGIARWTNRRSGTPDRNESIELPSCTLLMQQQW